MSIMRNMYIILLMLLMLVFFRAAYIYLPTMLLVLLASIKRLNVGISIIIAGLSMATIAFSKELVGDAANYARYYDFTSTLSLVDFLSNTNSGFSSRRTEVVFRLYNWFFSTTGVSFEWFHSVTIFAIYVLMITFGYKVYDYLDGSDDPAAKISRSLDRLFVILWVIFVCVTFSLTSQVMKQYMSIAVFSVGLAFSFRSDQKKYYIPTLIVSVLIHNATALLLLVYFVSRVLESLLSRPIGKTLFVVLAFLIGSIVISLLGPLGEMLRYGGLESGPLGPTVLVDAALVVGAVLVNVRKNFDNRLNLLWNFVFLFICALIFFRDIPIIATRMYFYMDIMRVIIGILIYRSFGAESRGVLVVSVIMLGPIYWSLKLYSSGWHYGWYSSSDFLLKFIGG
jgi:hypothetical protein